MNAHSPSLRTLLKETAMPVTVSPPVENPDAELLAAYAAFHAHNRLITDPNSPWWCKSSSDERSNEGNAIWEKLRDRVLSFTPKTPLGFGVMALMAFHETLFLEDIPRDEYLKWDGYSVPSEECEDFHSPLTASLWPIVAASGVSSYYNSDMHLLDAYAAFLAHNHEFNNSSAWAERIDEGAALWYELRDRISSYTPKTPLGFGVLALMAFHEGIENVPRDAYYQWDGYSVPNDKVFHHPLTDFLWPIVAASGIAAYRATFASIPTAE